MTIMDALLAFSFAALLLTLTPGLDTALVLRTATVEGRKQAVHAALGISTGCLVWGAAVALYLSWLGINMLLRPRKQLALADNTAKKGSNWFLKGVLGNALNPKIGIFYVSFLPQFIPQGHSPVLWTFILVGIHIVIGTSWSMALISATRPLATILRKEKVIRWMDRTTGAIFLDFAARLSLSRR